MSGWLKLHRQLQDNPLWLAEPFTRGQAWVDLLMIANHTPGRLYLRGNRIDVDRGVAAWSKIKLAERWKWSRGKVLRFLSELEKDGQVVQQTVHNLTLITLCNYDEYQKRSDDAGTTDSTTNDTTGSTTDGQQTVHIKEEQKQQEGKETPPPKNGGRDGDEIVFTLPAKGGTVCEIDRKTLERYRENFPNLDVMDQLRAISQYLEDNPHKRVPEWNTRQFVTNWLTNRISDKGKQAQSASTHGGFDKRDYHNDPAAAKWKKSGTTS